MSNNKILIRNNISGLEYALFKKGSDSWYICANDGRVPSGQMIYGNDLNEVLRGINCSLISQ